MRPRTAALLLRLPFGTGSPWRRRAIATVLRDEPVAPRAVARVLRSDGHETVWRTWLELSPRRWASPLPAELLDGPVPGEAVDAAWHDWLNEHDATLWSLLERWDRPATAPGSRPLSLLALRDAVVDARLLAETAARFDHPIGERARARLPESGEAVELFCAAALESPDAVAFCVAHHLAPADDVQRAVFFARTGQHEQYRALDPDGALLALGYRSASSQARALLRAAMTSLGGIDALRVLAGQRQRDDLASLTGEERAYLVRQLADQGDWERLWSLALSLPLAEAVAAVRAFGDWRPSGTDDRRVFEALRAADPAAVRTCVAALSAAPPAGPHARILLTDLGEPLIGVVDLDFAPDGEQLAFVGRDVRVGRNQRAGIIDIGGRRLARPFAAVEYSVAQVAHLGSDAIVVVADGEGSVGPGRQGRTRIDYIGPYARRSIAVAADVHHPENLRRIAGDQRFIALAGQGYGSLQEFRLFVGAGDRPLLDTGVLKEPSQPRSCVTVGPGGRLIAVVDTDKAVVADLDGSAVNVLGSDLPLAGGAPKAALSPSVLIRGDHDGHVQVWREPLTSTAPAAWGRLWPQGNDKLLDLAWSPALNRFLAISHQTTYLGKPPELEKDPFLAMPMMSVPRLEMLDVPAGPLPEALVSDSVALGVTSQTPVDVVRLSPKGDLLALASVTYPAVDLYDLSVLALHPVIGGPMALMTHADLASATAVRQSLVLDDASRRTLELLRTCLEHRFRGDIGIGDAAVSAAEDDIGLGRRC